jgi:DNA polymerase III epsilon subunit-like protein
MSKILFIDTETGGLDPEEHSLLSVGLVIWENGELIKDLEILITDEVITFTPNALSVNKIDFLEHMKRALGKKEAISRIMDFCKIHFPENEKITIAGHNIKFDVQFLKKLFGQEGFSKLFSHRMIDTSSILKFLQHSGYINFDISSSDKAFAYFGLISEKRHTALEDARMTAILYNNLINLVHSECRKASVP